MKQITEIEKIKKAMNRTDNSFLNMDNGICSFKEELKIYREKHNLTQHSMGYRLGVTATHVCYMESGQRNPSDEVLEKFNALGAV